MAQEQVQIFDLQPAQCRIAGITQVLAREPALGRSRLRLRTEERLAADAKRIARQAQIGQHITQQLLGGTVGVVFRAVEQIDAGIVCGRHQLTHLPA